MGGVTKTTTKMSPPECQASQVGLGFPSNLCACPRAVLGSTKHCFLDLVSAGGHEVLLPSFKPGYIHRNWRKGLTRLCQSLCWIMHPVAVLLPFHPRLVQPFRAALLGPRHGCFPGLLDLVHDRAPWLARGSEVSLENKHVINILTKHLFREFFLFS